MESRRSFVGSAAAFVTALGWTGCVTRPAAGEASLPAWRPGDLDLHFIYTGCGENMFYRLPDGTAILNDTGDYYRPKHLAHVPLLPSPDRLGGDWVSRYIRRVYPERKIDYAVFSHWHNDHVGHARFDAADTPNEAFRHRTTADGRKIDGFLCVAEDFSFDRVFDHQYPRRGMYATHDTSMTLLTDWLGAQGEAAPHVEPFVVGALDQICLRRDPARYRGRFSIRNVCANGVVWDGKSGTVDVIGEHAAVTRKKKIPQNLLSGGMLIRYGRFSYFTGGDIQRDPVTRRDGAKVPFDAYVGAATGPVTVCKMSHHGCSNAMGEAFLDAVRADAYVACMWCPAQSAADTLDRIAAAPTPRSSRALIVPQLVAPVQRDWMAAHGYGVRETQAVHVVVRVKPDAQTYTLYLLDAADESSRVVAKFERAC